MKIEVPHMNYTGVCSLLSTVMASELT